MSGNENSNKKDDPNAVGVLGRAEMAMIIIGAVILLIVGTFAAVVIIAVQNSADSFTVTGDIDLGLFSGVVFTIAGSGILYLGIAQGSKVANKATELLTKGESRNSRRWKTDDDSGEHGRQGTLEAIQARLDWYDKDIEGHLKNIEKWETLKGKMTDASMKAYCDALIKEEQQDIKDTQAQKKVQLDRLERYKRQSTW